MVSSKKIFLIYTLWYYILIEWDIFQLLSLVLMFSTKNCQSVQTLDQGHSVSSCYDSHRLPQSQNLKSSGDEAPNNFRSLWFKMRQIVFWVDWTNLMHTNYF